MLSVSAVSWRRWKGNLTMKLMLQSLTTLALISLLGISCATSEAKQNFFSKIAHAIKYKTINYKHKSPTAASWSKCEAFDVGLHGKQFKYKEHFCYRWCSKRSRTGNRVKCKTWQVKKYHFIDDHDLMVSRGVWRGRAAE